MRIKQIGKPYKRLMNYFLIKDDGSKSAKIITYEGFCQIKYSSNGALRNFSNLQEAIDFLVKKWGDDSVEYMFER